MKDEAIAQPDTAGLGLGRGVSANAGPQGRLLSARRPPVNSRLSGAIFLLWEPESPCGFEREPGRIRAPQGSKAYLVDGRQAGVGLAGTVSRVCGGVSQ